MALVKGQIVAARRRSWEPWTLAFYARTERWSDGIDHHQCIDPNGGRTWYRDCIPAQEIMQDASLGVPDAGSMKAGEVVCVRNSQDSDWHIRIFKEMHEYPSGMQARCRRAGDAGDVFMSWTECVPLRRIEPDAVLSDGSAAEQDRSEG